MRKTAASVASTPLGQATRYTSSSCSASLGRPSRSACRARSIVDTSLAIDTEALGATVPGVGKGASGGETLGISTGGFSDFSAARGMGAAPRERALDGVRSAGDVEVLFSSSNAACEGGVAVARGGAGSLRGADWTSETGAGHGASLGADS